MQIEAGSKLVVTGDSVTDCGRARPVGDGLGAELGNGYVALLNGLLNATYPERHIRVVNTGVSGDTVRDLKARWKTDVLDQKPDWLSVMIGINDVWRQFDQPTLPERGVPLDEYASTLEALVRSALPLKGLVLLSPFYLEPNRADPMRAMIDRYGSAVEEIARRNGAVFVDTQAAMDRLLGGYYPAAITWDRVHPNLMGQAALVRAFLNAVGYRWEP